MDLNSGAAAPLASSGVLPFSEDGGRVMPISEVGRAHVFEAGDGREMSFLSGGGG